MLKRYAKAPHHTMLIEMSLNHLARYLLLSVLTLLWQPAIAAIDGSHLVDRGLSDISTSPLVYFEDAEASYTPQRAWQRLNALRDVKQATLPLLAGADTGEPQRYRTDHASGHRHRLRTDTTGLPLLR